jgi:AAA+ superfamily predicted ATPase
MDGQENTTSTTGKNSATKRRFFSALNTILPFLLMVTLTSVCYLFIPVGVFIVAGKLISRIGVVIPAVLSVLGIWYLPTMVSGAIAEAIDILTGKNNRGQVGDLFGMIIGTSLLTILWFFPLWNHVFPAFAAVLQPFHVASMFDNPWLIGLSWLVCIPIPVYATLSAIEDQGRNKSTNATKSQQVGSTESESGQHTHEEFQKNQSSTDNPDESRRATSNQPSSALTFAWESAPPTRFRDVGGMDDLKRNIMRSVLRPLSHTDAAYERFNVSPPNGILLHGPPGTGKTHFARAIAGELGHPYLELSAGDIKSRWVNESTEQVNQLFNEAEQFERCVIFVDEIDALLAGRGNDLHREHAQVVNEFLAHLDDEDPSFLLIAATNRADLLDEAATRRGRFDQQYEVDLPDKEARELIFRVRLRELPSDLDDDDYETLAEQTADRSAADIVGMVDDAAMRAAERDAEVITKDDLLDSGVTNGDT